MQLGTITVRWERLNLHTSSICPASMHNTEAGLLLVRHYQYSTNILQNSNYMVSGFAHKWILICRSTWKQSDIGPSANYTERMDYKTFIDCWYSIHCCYKNITKRMYYRGRNENNCVGARSTRGLVATWLHMVVAAAASPEISWSPVRDKTPIKVLYQTLPRFTWHDHDLIILHGSPDHYQLRSLTYL